MYTFYVLRGAQSGKIVELDGDVSAEGFPGIDLDDGPAIITYLVEHTESASSEWEECDLTDDFFNREDNYINFNGRWMRRADAPWRKDRNN